MAFDKVVDSAWLEAGLKKVCDGIRSKTGGAANLAFPDEMDAEIRALGAQEDLAPELSAQDGLIDQLMEVLPKECAINIKRVISPSPALGYVRIGENTYRFATPSTPGDYFVIVDQGTEIELYVDATSDPGFSVCEIVVDGNVVATSQRIYKYTVLSDVDITLEAKIGSSGAFGGTINLIAKSTIGEPLTPTNSGGTTYKSKFADNNTDLSAILGVVKNVAIHAYEDISPELTEQASLIAQIATALEGKAAGGGGVPETVEIDNLYGSHRICYTDENGEPATATLQPNKANSVKVAKGQLCAVFPFTSTASSSKRYYTGAGATELGKSAYYAVFVPSANCTISYELD